MAKPTIEFKWQPDAFVLASIMSQIDADVRREAEKGIKEIANNATRDLRKRTPGQNLPKGWAGVVTQNTPASLRIEVRNFDPRAYKVIKLNDGRSTNLVEILEYGTSPTKDIVPKRYKGGPGTDTGSGPKALSFEAYGKRWVLKRVKHVGIRPYAMVRLTFLSAAVEMAQLQFKITKMIQKKFKSGD